MKKRYFRTGNANRPYKKEGHIFEFERIEFQSGTWLGVSVETDETRADVLKGFGGPVAEISENEYKELKKKLNSRSGGYVQPVPDPAGAPKQEKEEVLAVEGDLEQELTFRAPPKSDGKDPEEASPAPKAKPQPANKEPDSE